MSRYSIGVDLGGTNLRAAAISESGEMLGKIAGSTELRGGREAVLGEMVDQIVALRSQHGTDNCAGVGIGVPGFIRFEDGVVVGSNNLPELEGAPVQKEVESRLGMPVILENDANAAALGEFWKGAGHAVDDLVLLTLGTGIGGGIIAGGRIVHGAVGMAGEIGHLTVAPSGNPCGCGNTGCLEKHASASALEGMAVMLGFPPGTTPKDLQQAASEGNQRARMIFDRMGWALGTALAALINIFNFPLFLLSGGMLPAWDLFAPAMLSEVEKRSFTFRNTHTRIEAATLGAEAGLYGAAHLPFQR